MSTGSGKAAADDAITSAAPTISAEEARQLHVISSEPAADASSAAPAAAAAPTYYWEAGDDAPLPPVTERVAQTLEWLFARVVTTAEFVGEIFTDILGLNNPRYEWAVEAERNRIAEVEEAERIIAQRERWALIQRMNGQAGRAPAPSSAGDAGEVAAPPGGAGATAPVLAESGAAAPSGGEGGAGSAAPAADVPAAASSGGAAVEEAAPTAQP